MHFVSWIWDELIFVCLLVSLQHLIDLILLTVRGHTKLICHWSTPYNRHIAGQCHLVDGTIQAVIRIVFLQVCQLVVKKTTCSLLNILHVPVYLNILYFRDENNNNNEIYNVQ